MDWLPFLYVNPDGTWTGESAQEGDGGRGDTASAALEDWKRIHLELYDQTPQETLDRLPTGTMAEWRKAVENMSVERCVPVSRSSFNQALNQAVPPKPRRGWWPFSRDPKPLTVSRVREFPHGAFFRRNRLVYVECPQYGLEIMRMPGGGSIGLFAFDGEVLRCLNRRSDHLREVLRIEGRPPNLATPADLAHLVADVLGRQGNNGHEVVTAESLEQREGREKIGGGYEIDRVEFERVLPGLTPPVISAEDGWLLKFVTLSGWMHRTQTLEAWQVSVSEDYQLEVERKVLTDRIFTRVPDVIY